MGDDDFLRLGEGAAHAGSTGGSGDRTAHRDTQKLLASNHVAFLRFFSCIDLHTSIAAIVWTVKPRLGMETAEKWA
jgi:hypothetical protein